MPVTLSQPPWPGRVDQWCRGASSFAAQFLLPVAEDSPWQVGDSFKSIFLVCCVTRVYPNARYIFFA